MPSLHSVASTKDLEMANACCKNACKASESWESGQHSESPQDLCEGEGEEEGEAEEEIYKLQPDHLIT